MSDFSLYKDRGKKLEDRELDLAVEFASAITLMNDEIADIQRRCNAEALVVRDQYVERAKKAWFEIMHLNGVDAEKAWENHSWYVEVQYVDDFGCAFLLKNKTEGMEDLWKETLLPPTTKRH